jgi:hypothetical protein
MRSLGVGLLAAVTMVCAEGRALAAGEDYEATGGTEKPYAHGGQFKLYAQTGLGYRMIFRYDEDDFCGQAGKTACRSTVPMWVELGVGYGITDSFELLTDIRIGLGKDFVPSTSPAERPKQLVIAPGIRVFIDDAGSIKFFTTFQLAIDRTDYAASGVATATDFGIRNVNGFLIDLHRTFGVYVHVGETIGFVRWLRFEVDGGIGMMIRLP